MKPNPPSYMTTVTSAITTALTSKATTETTTKEKTLSIIIYYKHNYSNRKLESQSKQFWGQIVFETKSSKVYSNSKSSNNNLINIKATAA